MATLGQTLAARIRYQIEAGEKVLKAAGAGTDKDRSDAVFGSPQDVLTVRGNVSDVAHTNHLWLLDAVAAGALEVELSGALRRERPTSIPAAVEFLAPRDTDSAYQAVVHLRLVNEAIAGALERLSDSGLERRLNVTFYGDKSVTDLAFAIIEHGSLHIGQAWGILKGSGLAG